MLTVLIVIHLMIVIAMVGVVLLQKSEGGGLVSSTSGFLTGRGTANVLTRTTAFLAIGFFLTSLALSWLAGLGRRRRRKRPRARSPRRWAAAAAASSISYRAVPLQLPRQRRAGRRYRSRNRSDSMLEGSTAISPQTNMAAPSAWAEDCWRTPGNRAAFPACRSRRAAAIPEKRSSNRGIAATG
jgi:preprotein translocase subunit SecG